MAQKKIKFNEFVNELGNWKIIEKHHFKFQTSEAFTNEIMNSKIIKCFDVENIDYEFIEKLYNKKIPKDIIEYRGGHDRNKNISNLCSYYIPIELIKFKEEHKKYKTRQDSQLGKCVYNSNLEEYYNLKLETKYFYNEGIKQKIFNFYKNDFLFFNKFGVDYTLKL